MSNTAASRPLFTEHFDIDHDGVPGNWEIERNSDIRHPGIALEENALKVFAPGNKFLPVVPDLSDGRITTTVAFDNVLSDRLEVQLLFRYDRHRRTGQGGRLKLHGESLLFEYGTVTNNIFSPVDFQAIDIGLASFDDDNTLILEFADDRMSLELVGVGKAEFSCAKPGKGSVALARGQFNGYMTVTRYEISTLDDLKPVEERSFDIVLPEGVDGNYYPVVCTVAVREYENLIDLDMSFSGSVQEEPLGDGNYHALRVDKITRPFLKVIAPLGIEQYTLADGTLMLTNHEMVPPFYYQVLYDDPEWPMRRRVRFRRPDSDFALALGYEYFYHKQTSHQAGGPSETVFSIDGTILYSGRSLIDNSQVVEFRSAQDKAIIADLPTDDPRYEKAAAFGRDNHYFKHGEDVWFDIVISSVRVLPEKVSVILESAYFEPLKTIDATKAALETCASGALSYRKQVYRVSLGEMDVGVYHLRCRDATGIADDLDEYIAFEVMPNDVPLGPVSGSAQTISGLPYLFSCLTETRGLETDHFDPWRGKSVNAGHYISCACFHPGFAQRNRIWETVKRYGREWYAWLNQRTIDDYSLESNIEAVKHCDYIYRNLIQTVSLHRLLLYEGELLECLKRFVATLENNPCRYLTMKALENVAGRLSLEAFKELCDTHWDAWVEYALAWAHPWRKEKIAELEAINPDIRLSTYGPVHIYAGHYKGLNYARYIGFTEQSPEYYKGFFLYEDYPVSSDYSFAKGVFFLTACKQILPQARIYPEIYTIVDQGCPDGALVYAFPPFGMNMNNPKARIKRRIFEYVYATGWHGIDGFHFWRDAGFHISSFDKKRYETLLSCWRVVKQHPPARPMKGTAFISNSECCRNWPSIPEPSGGSPIKTSEECIAFAYEQAREAGLQAGFQSSLESVDLLSSDDIDLLVLPPLKGITDEQVQTIRRLHEQGVNLLGFEDVTGLEDLFGVTAGPSVRVHELQATKTNPVFYSQLSAATDEYTNYEACRGKYRSADAKVLIDAEVPVLFEKQTTTGRTALFNIPPTVVRRDELHQRDCHGRHSVSLLINSATSEILTELSDAAVTTTVGQIIACETEDERELVIVENICADAHITPRISVRKTIPSTCIESCDVSFHVVSESEYEIQVDLRIPEEETAVIVLNAKEAK